MKGLCKNCSHKLEGNYCKNCGQSAHTHDINFKEFLHEIQHSILHVDKGILFTTKELFIRPGHAIKEYIDGKRVRHFKPIAYILILSTVYAILSKMASLPMFTENFLTGFMNGFEDGPNPNPKFKSFISIINWLVSHYAYFTLITLPILSLASYIIFNRAKYNYFQHIVLNCYIAGQRTVLYLVFLLLFYFLPNVEFVKDLNAIIKMIGGMMLTFWTYYQFFDAYSPIKRISFTILHYFLIAAFFFILTIFLLFLVT